MPLFTRPCPYRNESQNRRRRARKLAALAAVTDSIDVNVRNDADHGLSCGHTRGTRSHTYTPEGRNSPRRGIAGSGERERGEFRRRTRIVHTTHTRRIAVTSDRRHALPLLGRGISRDRSHSLLRLIAHPADTSRHLAALLVSSDAVTLIVSTNGYEPLRLSFTLDKNLSARLSISLNH